MLKPSGNRWLCGYLTLALLHRAPAADIRQIDAWIAAGRLNEAEAAAREQVKAQPVSPDAHALLGYILFKENNPKESLAEYAAAARYRGPSASDLEVIGSDYFLMEDYARADASGRLWVGAGQEKRAWTRHYYRQEAWGRSHTNH